MFWARADTQDKVDVSTPLGQPNIFLERDFFEKAEEPFT